MTLERVPGRFEIGLDRVLAPRAETATTTTLMKARNAIGSGDRAEMRRPPTVVRKPPLTARMTAAAASDRRHDREKPSAQR